MDFEEKKDQSHQANVKKNRATMLALFALFIIPVALAYAAYFNGWFASATKNRGEILSERNVVDIEDFEFKHADGKLITGKEFETLYWWILPIDMNQCDSECLQLNIYTINQTYLGLGKEAKRINVLLILPTDTLTETNTVTETNNFPTAFSPFSNIGVQALNKTQSGLNKDLPANFIYLVDPLGNVFMRYPLVKNKPDAVKTSKDLRTDLLRLFKYSRLG